MVQILSPEEVARIEEETRLAQPALQILSPEQVSQMESTMSPEDYAPANNPDIDFLDYLKTVPATAVDITLGSGEGFASAIGTFTGNYNLARSIGAFRDDVNDAIMGDVPSELQSDFIYKLSSGLGSTLPFLGAAIISRNPSYLAKIGAGAFFLSSAGQQVRDDYLATHRALLRKLQATVKC